MTQMTEVLYDPILGCVGWKFINLEGAFTPQELRTTDTKVIRKKVKSNPNSSLKQFLFENRKGKKQNLTEWLKKNL